MKSDKRSHYIDQIIAHLQENETEPEDFQLGLEIEHLLVKKSDCRSVAFQEERGIADLFDILTGKGWKACEKSGNQILCLVKEEDEINLEPGGQIEFSFGPKNSIAEIKRCYLDICRDIMPVLKKLDYSLINLGYHPVTRIEEIPLLSKDRYRQMYHHFKSRGRFAHNMMKGTASTQVSVDYQNPADFDKKLKVASWLIPIFYAIFDNSPIFEGRREDKWVLRFRIWAQCDHDRCGILPGIFDRDFYSYRDYAGYIIDLPAIYNPEKKKEYLGEISFAKLYQRLGRTELQPEDFEHMLSFAFNDVRAKEYLEIRMADSLPYPLFFGYLALIKGIFYQEENLNYYYDKIKDINRDSILQTFDKISERGIETCYLEDKTLKEWGEDLIFRARKGLDKDENLMQLTNLENYLARTMPPRKRFSGKEISFDSLKYADLETGLGCELADEIKLS